jgi:hypothetical protein
VRQQIFEDALKVILALSRRGLGPQANPNFYLGEIEHIATGALKRDGEPDDKREPVEAPMGGNNGHGHVWRRPDGMRARCGGPAICAECAKDAARLKQYRETGR